MNYIDRVYDQLGEKIKEKRVTIIYGPRRIGKTTLVSNYLNTLGGKAKILRVSAENLSIQKILSSQEKDDLLDWVYGYNVVFIDEAQNVKNIGISLKILIDSRPELNIIVTGSASFDLANKVGEPLTGRQTPLQLLPIAMSELSSIYNKHELREKLEDFLIYGMYPEIRTAKSSADKQFILTELVESTLLKDILAIERFKDPKILVKLLSLIALQLGNEVSHNELASMLRIDVKTIGRYLFLLEKCYIIYNLRGFSRNLRNEVTRTGKYYFYDNGVRNAVINNYNPLDNRNDVGALWENFAIIERLKYRLYNNIVASDYFWRTWEQQEIDLIEDRAGKLFAYEFKYSPKKTPKIPSVFAKNYPESEYSVISAKNFLDFCS